MAPILRVTHSIDYEAESLPSVLLRRSQSAAVMILDKAREDAAKPPSYLLARGGALSKPDSIFASNIEFALKAPISMTVIPLLASIIPRMKFLHVIR